MPALAYTMIDRGINTATVCVALFTANKEQHQVKEKHKKGDSHSCTQTDRLVTESYSVLAGGDENPAGKEIDWHYGLVSSIYPANPARIIVVGQH